MSAVIWVSRGGLPVRRERPAPSPIVVPGDQADSSNTSQPTSCPPGITRSGGNALCYRRTVADVPAQATVYDVVCPHCGKSFREELLTGPAQRYHGFKCPHCRLFVPFERVEQDAAQPVD
jgi:DNA-directed RNA polymerase subunit RPC12/RpoP